MADFLANLWESVFTPGATPTLLLATNFTFAFLQLTLAGLLAVTFSIHFVILSILCGGLWWSINWFADEVRQAQEKEEEAKRIRKRQEQDRQDGSGADDEGEDTETEPVIATKYEPTEKDQEIREKILDDLKKQGQATQATNATATAMDLPDDTRQRKANSDMSGSTDFSTDSEWEKVDR